MVNLKLRSGTVDLYEHSDEQPIELYNLSNEYAMRDAHIGSSMQDVLKHHERIHFFIAQKDFDAVLQTSKNMYQCYFNILERNNFRGFGFNCFVKAVNGRDVYDYGFDAIKGRLTELSRMGLTMGHVNEIVPALKKKSYPSFASRFLKSLRTRPKSRTASTSATASSPS